MNYKKYNAFIYGAGDMYNKLSSYLPLHEKNLNILGIVTSSKPLYAYIDNHPCYSVDEVNFEQADFIIIAVAKWEDVWEILKQRSGVSEEKIIRSHVFEYPGFNLDEYIELKKSNVSILSNDCLAGYTYEKLGLKFLSPTINMFCPGGGGYIEFLENYEYFMECEMQELGKATYIYGTSGIDTFVPKGMLGGKIQWNFVHDIYAEQAIEKWNMRKKRFNVKNVAATMVVQSDEDAYRFEKLNIEKRIGVYHKDLHLEHIIYCPEWNNKELREKHNYSWESFGLHYMINKVNGCIVPINWIKFLLGKEDNRRKILL